MTARDFCYWLQGYFEIHECNTGQTRPLDFSQIDCIKKHLSLVFKHEIDPSFPAGQQEALNKIHQGDVHITSDKLEQLKKELDKHLSDTSASHTIVRC